MKERTRADQLMSKLDDMSKQITELFELMKLQEKENARLKDKLAQALKVNTALSEQHKLERKTGMNQKARKT